jgi:hypothetical protein
VYKPSKQELDAIRAKLAAQRRLTSGTPAPRPSFSGYSDPVLQVLDLLVKGTMAAEEAAPLLAQSALNAIKQKLGLTTAPDVKISMDDVLLKNPRIDLGPPKRDTKDDPLARLDELGRKTLTFDETAKKEATVGYKIGLATAIADAEKLYKDQVRDAQDLRDKRVAIDPNNRAAAADAEREMRWSVARFKQIRDETVGKLRQKLLDAGGPDARAGKAAPAGKASTADAYVLGVVSAKITQEVNSKTQALIRTARENNFSAAWLRDRMTDVQRTTAEKWGRILKEVSP